MLMISTIDMFIMTMIINMSMRTNNHSNLKVAMLEATNARIKHEINYYNHRDHHHHPHHLLEGEGPGGAFEENRRDGRREPGAPGRGLKTQGGECQWKINYDGCLGSDESWV